MKKYIVTLNTATSYTFTGADRDASFNPASDVTMDATVVSSTSGGNAVKFMRHGAKAVITRARLVSAGAPGLQSVGTSGAGVAKLSFSENGVTPSVISLAFFKWNEWEEKNIQVDFGEGDICDAVLDDSSVFHVDDFNIQSDFVGETFTPVIEIEMKSGNATPTGFTYGLVDKVSGDII